MNILLKLDPFFEEFSSRRAFYSGWDQAKNKNNNNKTSQFFLQLSFKTNSD